MAATNNPKIPLSSPAGVGQGASVADALLSRGREVQDANEADISASPIDLQFKDAFATQIEAKHDQVERIENRLESLLDKQERLMQQTENERPGRLALPKTRVKWNEAVQAQKDALRRLQDRLGRVREIRDGMSPSGPRIEELALKKLRSQDPDLVAGWHEMQQAQRVHQLHMRTIERERRRNERKQQERSGEGGGRSLLLAQD